MTGSPRRIGALVALAGILLITHSAHAEAPPGATDIDLSYAAPVGCASRTEFEQEIGRRVDPRWLAGGDRRSFDVRVERLPDGTFAGRLEVLRAGHSLRVREIRDPACKAVSTALAVFIAIAVDPANVDADTPAMPAPLPPEPQAVEHPASPLAPSEPPLRTSRPPRNVSGAPAPSSWSLGAAAGAVHMRVPNDAWGARFGAEVARSWPASRVSPALRVSWGFADFTVFPPRAGRAEFRFQTTRFEGCARVDASPLPLTLSPCLGFDVGSLAAAAPDAPEAGHATVGWRAATGVARVAWELLPWLALEGEVGFELPFQRTTFALDKPIRMAYRPPAVLFTAGAGLHVTTRFR
ncbi:MAG: hypothetical protein BGO98_01895 [Myxococcales bacterium 68-20]|nr:hypothetical protein [Myxococcales bacterium]OJY20013.1 MAG: hypothetical protein BGO98_01895 [Myxococcales bacterium 68-20]